MTTLADPTYSGPLAGGDERAACRQDAAQVGAAASNEIPILADGLLFMVATGISRLITGVFGTTVYSAAPIEGPDDYYPPSCCCWV